MLCQMKQCEIYLLPLPLLLLLPVLLLPLQAVVLVAIGVGPNRHLGEEVQHGVVTKVLGDLAKVQEPLERVLHEESGYDAHGGGEGGRADAVALKGLLVDARGHHQGRGAREAGSAARVDELKEKLTCYVFKGRGKRLHYTWMCPETAFSDTPDSNQGWPSSLQALLMAMRASKLSTQDRTRSRGRSGYCRKKMHTLQMPIRTRIFHII